jgi:hypothetical protein
MLVPAGETARRIRQLLQERVTRAEIAQALGLKRPRLEVPTGRGDWIALRTALRIKRLHRRWLSDDGE